MVASPFVYYNHLVSSLFFSRLKRVRSYIVRDTGSPIDATEAGAGMLSHSPTERMHFVVFVLAQRKRGRYAAVQYTSAPCGSTGGVGVRCHSNL